MAVAQVDFVEETFVIFYLRIDMDGHLITDGFCLQVVSTCFKLTIKVLLLGIVIHCVSRSLTSLNGDKATQSFWVPRYAHAILRNLNGTKVLLAFILFFRTLKIGIFDVLDRSFSMCNELFGNFLLPALPAHSWI